MLYAANSCSLGWKCQNLGQRLALGFVKGAADVVGHKPTRVTTDGHYSYPRAIRRILGRKVEHRTGKYLDNRLEQDHRGIKQRYYPMRGFRSFESASPGRPHDLSSDASALIS